MKKMSNVTLVLLLSLTILLTACTKSSNTQVADTGTTSKETSNSSTLIIAAESLPSSLEVENSIGYNSQEATLNANATLIRNPYITVNGVAKQDLTKFEPLLAEKYEVSKDGFTVTFYLKKGIMSPEGNELKAADVLYSMQRKIKTGSIAGFIASIGSVLIDADKQLKIIDDYTIQFTMNKKNEYTLLSMLANQHLGSIYDSKLLQSKKTTDDPWSLKYASQHSYGYGPYKLVEFTPGQQIVWESNKKYVMGPPAYKKIIVREVKDTSTRVSLLKGGDVQIAEQVRPRDQEVLKNEFMIPHVDTNMSVFTVLNTSIPPFNNPKVRQAMAYVIPYDRIIKQVYLDRAKRMYGPLYPSIPGYDGTAFEKYKYDLETAKKLLNEAGLPEGFTVTMTYDTGNVDLKEAANIIKTSASEAGIIINLQEMPVSAYQSAKATGKLQMMLDRDYSIVLSPSYVSLLFFDETSPLNWAKWKNKSYLETVSKGTMTSENELGSEAQQFWKHAQKILSDELPFIWIAYVEPLVALNKNVQGYAHRTDNVIPYELLKPAN